MQQSYVSWMISALGFPYLVLLAAAGLLSCVLALIIVLRGKGPLAASALILIVHIPLLIGIFAAIQGSISSFLVIATSETAPKPAEVAAGLSTAQVAPMVGIICMIPGYFVGAIGAFLRCLNDKSSDSI